MLSAFLCVCVICFCTVSTVQRFFACTWYLFNSITHTHALSLDEFLYSIVFKYYHKKNDETSFTVEKCSFMNDSLNSYVIRKKYILKCLQFYIVNPLFNIQNFIGKFLRFCFVYLKLVRPTIGSDTNIYKTLSGSQYRIRACTFLILFLVVAMVPCSDAGKSDFLILI